MQKHDTLKAKCPYCGGSHIKAIESEDGLKVYQCQNCRFMMDEATLVHPHEGGLPN